MRPPFYFLNKSVSILIVDDDQGVRTMLEEILQPIELYAVRGAANCREAEPVLGSLERIHLCILDLGLRDIANDEFFLLKKYSSRVSFIVFTGSASPIKGFKACLSGAKMVIEKSPEFNPGYFIKTVNTYALLNIINPRYVFGKDTLSASTDVLFEKTPKFVSEWALQMSITDRELRHIWTKNLGANAKIILTIHQMYRAAFDYYERLLGESGNFRNAPIQDQNAYRRLEEYYHCHRSTITDFLAFGNVASVL